MRSKPIKITSLRRTIVTAVLLRVGLPVLMAALLWSHQLSAAPIPVRFTEGSIHGFLLLHSLNDTLLAQGDLLTIARSGEVEKHMVLRFKDESLYDETVVFTQQSVYVMQSYRLIQQGPIFPEDTEVLLERTGGKYHVKTKAHKDGLEKVVEGTLDLPPDVYNGMIPDVVKDLPKGAGETVHYVIFTPSPRIIELQISPAVEQKVQVGELEKSAVRYVLKAHFGILLKLLVKVLGSTPPDYYTWIIPDEVPVFVGFEGQLYMAGPVWRIELTSALLPK